METIIMSEYSQLVHIHAHDSSDLKYGNSDMEKHVGKRASHIQTSIFDTRVELDFIESSHSWNV